MYKIIQIDQKNNFAADLSTALFNLDPGGTMCVANSSHDEYNSIAMRLADINGTFVDADMILSELRHAFDDECEMMTTAETIAQLAAFFSADDGYLFVADNQTFDGIGVVLPSCLMNDIKQDAAAQGKTIGGVIADIVSKSYKG